MGGAHRTNDNLRNASLNEGLEVGCDRFSVADERVPRFDIPPAIARLQEIGGNVSRTFPVLEN